jgi:hypothetical protein
MKGKKRFFMASFLFPACFAALCVPALCAVALCTACSFPIGSLQPNPSLGVTESNIEAVRLKDEYRVGDKFDPAKDFELYVYYGDTKALIDNILDNDGVEITITGDPAAGSKVTMSKKQQKLDGHKFQSAKPNKKNILITLNGMKDNYDVWVEEKTSGSGSPILIVNWPDKP